MFFPILAISAAPTPETALSSVREPTTTPLSNHRGESLNNASTSQNPPTSRPLATPQAPARLKRQLVESVTAVGNPRHRGEDRAAKEAREHPDDHSWFVHRVVGIDDQPDQQTYRHPCRAPAQTHRYSAPNAD